MQQYERLQYYFQILSDINRFRIIKFINIEERTVSEIVRETNLSLVDILDRTSDILSDDEQKIS